MRVASLKCSSSTGDWWMRICDRMLLSGKVQSAHLFESPAEGQEITDGWLGRQT